MSLINSKTIAILPTPENIRVMVIGCGAIGSKIVNEACRIGLQWFTLWDHDKVVLYNVGNQAFYPQDVDKEKVMACKENVWKINPGAMVVTNARKFDGEIDDHPLYVFVAVDSMKARKEIFESLMDYVNLSGKHFVIIDTRMNLYEVSCYSCNTRSKDTLVAYEKSLYDDGKVKPEFTSVCGTVQGLGTISSIASSMAIQKLIQHESSETISYGESIINIKCDAEAVSFMKKFKNPKEIKHHD